MGRPRSAAAHSRVLQATLDLVADRGIEATSMDAISHQSGVSKATLYKHWSSKEALCLEALCQLGELPQIDTGHARDDLVTLLSALAETPSPKTWARIWPRVMGYAASNADFGTAFRTQTVEPRRGQVRRLLQQAVALGDLRDTMEVEWAVDLLVGAVMHRRFAALPMPPGYIEYVVNTVWTAHLPP